MRAQAHACRPLAPWDRVWSCDKAVIKAAELNGWLHTLAEDMQPSIISRTFPRTTPPPIPQYKDFACKENVRIAGGVHANPRGPGTGAGAGDVLGLPAPSHAARARRMQLQEALLAREAVEAVQDTVCRRRCRQDTVQDTPRPPPEAKLEALYRERQQQHARERPPLPAPPMGVPAREPTRPSSLIDAEDQRLSLQGGATRHGRASARYGNTTAITSAIWTRRSDG